MGAMVMISLAVVAASCGGGDSDRRRLLSPQLQPIERRITTAPAQQLLVAAGFDDGSILDDKNAIGIHDRVQAMCDHNRRSPLAKVLDRALNLPLGFGIERGGCLIEQDDRRVFE